MLPVADPFNVNWFNLVKFWFGQLWSVGPGFQGGQAGRWTMTCV